MRWIVLAGLIWASGAAAQEADGRFRLAVPDALAASGLIDHLVPRFSLKHGIRIATVSASAAADARLGDAGRPVFAGPETLWRLEVGEDPDAAAFAEWLRSEVGQRTIAGYARDGAAPFEPKGAAERDIAEVALDGDAARGAEVAKRHCKRCHAVSGAPGMSPIGSTPSFRLLRGMGDWTRRFEGFYALNPHPAFTQIAEVTPPFDPRTPSPIVPVEMTLDDVSDVVAYVAGLAPADLGAPIEQR